MSLPYTPITLTLATLALRGSPLTRIVYTECAPKEYAII